MQRLPYAEPALGLPMSPQLETFLRAMRERPE